MRRLLVLAGIWGWSFLFIKVAVKGMTPVTVAAARVGLGAIVLLVVLRVRRLSIPRDRRWWRHFAVAALISNAAPFTLLAWGEERVSSALTSVLNASTPLFSALAVGAFLGERLRRVQLAGLLVGFVGVAVAAGVGGGDVSGSSVAGDLAAVAAAACYGLGFTYAQRYMTALPPEVASAGQLGMATILLLPAAVATSVTSGLDLNLRRVASIVLLGAVGTGLAYILYFRSIAEIGSTRTSVVTYLVPVVAVAVGVAFLHEDFHVRLLLGGALIAVGIAMLNRPARETTATVGA